jgi:para-nitrobenzyl esterase
MVAFMGTPDLWSADESSIRQRLEAFVPDDADDLLAGYRLACPGESLVSLYLQIVSDRAMRIPHIRFTEALLAGGNQAPRMYLFDFRRPSDDGVPRAGHGSDMPYFFDNIDKAPMAAGPHAGSLVQAMGGSLVALARSGDPNHAALPPWPNYSVSERATMLFDTPCHVEHDPLGAERRVWETVQHTMFG